MDPDDASEPISHGPGDDDLSLPRATVYKLITEMLPEGVSCPKETRDLLLACCTEFVHLISSEANDVCEKAGRKTIAPEHVLEALRLLGFETYVDDVQAAYDEHQAQAKEKERMRAGSRIDTTGMSQEELQRQQEELFEKARLRYQQAQRDSRDTVSSNPNSDNAS